MYLLIRCGGKRERLSEEEGVEQRKLTQDGRYENRQETSEKNKVTAINYDHRWYRRTLGGLHH